MAKEKTWSDLSESDGQAEAIEVDVTEAVVEAVEGVGLPDLANLVAEKLGDLPEDAIDPLFRRLLSLVGTQRELIPTSVDLSEAKKRVKSHEDKIKRLEQASGEFLEEIRSILSGEIPDDHEMPIERLEVDDSWREMETKELGLDTLKGMGAKKYEAILELAPTLGKLEDLRGEASRDHVPFATMLPEGVGAALASAIEEKILDEMSKGAI